MSELPRADATTIERRRRHACSATVLGATPSEAIERVHLACEATIQACALATRAAVGSGGDPWTSEWPVLAKALHDIEQAAYRAHVLVEFIREMHEALAEEKTP